MLTLLVIRKMPLEQDSTSHRLDWQHRQPESATCWQAGGACVTAGGSADRGNHPGSGRATWSSLIDVDAMTQLFCHWTYVLKTASLSSQRKLLAALQPGCDMGALSWENGWAPWSVVRDQKHHTVCLWGNMGPWDDHGALVKQERQALA